jgi:hypothetical protein
MNESLLGYLYSALSVITVYHLFALQMWLGRTIDISAEGYAVEAETTVGAMRRAFIKQRCRGIKRQFPWIQVVLLLAAMTAISWLAASATNQLSGTTQRNMLAPMAVLDSVMTISTIATWLRGMQVIRAVERIL